MNRFRSSNLTLIHGIRGICALIVAICHSKFFFWVGGNDYVQHFPRSGWSFVDYVMFALDLSTSNGSSMVVVFFVLSGFFIAYTFDKNHWTTANFYLVRFLRIYIPFIASLLVASFIFYLAFIVNRIEVHSTEANELISATKQSFNFHTLVNTFFFLRNDQGLYFAMNFPYWSLFHEGLFYLLAPFIIRKLRHSAVLSLILFGVGFFFKQQTMLQEFLFHYLFYFNLGMVFYKLIIGKPLFDTKSFHWLFIFGLFLAALFSFRLVGYRISFLLASVSALWAIQQIIYSEVREIFILRFLRQLGKISYTLYLFHVPVFMFLLYLIYKTGISLNYYHRNYYIASLFVLLFSVPLYKLVEGPSIRFIHSFRASGGKAKKPSGKSPNTVLPPV
jgi:peptidoglycan/LPS O-acetylase OafA/YrhL